MISPLLVPVRPTGIFFILPRLKAGAFMYKIGGHRIHGNRLRRKESLRIADVKTDEDYSSSARS